MGFFDLADWTFFTIFAVSFGLLCAIVAIGVQLHREAKVEDEYERQRIQQD